MADFVQLPVGDETARAYLRISEGARAGVVVLHAWWGLNDDVIAYADRLADAGFAVIAPDMFRGQIATEPADAERLSLQDEVPVCAAGLRRRRAAARAPRGLTRRLSLPARADLTDANAALTDPSYFPRPCARPGVSSPSPRSPQSR